ncbi:MAG TPA: universal stress protein [Thermoanaerobaculia bacterium]
MIRKILVPMDGSALAETALPQAVAVARACQAEVGLLRVLDTNGAKAGRLVDSVSWRLARTAASRSLEALAAKLAAQGVRVRWSVAEGDAAEEILRRSREEAVDLVVLCSHGKSGPSGFGLGSTSQKVLSRAGASVLVVRGAEPPAEMPAEARFPLILVPLDGSQRSQWALLQAVPLARASGSEILLVHVVAPPLLSGRTPPTPEEVELTRQMSERDRRSAEIYLRELQELLAGSGLQARTRLVESPQIVQTLLKIAGDEKAALIVVSAHGCSGAAPWPYGSVTDRLIHHGTVPLLVLQDLSFRAPGAGEEAALAATIVSV